MTGAKARPLRVIGYCRVSTKDQGNNGHGLGAQISALEHFCAQHGHELLTVTTDVVSGTASDRMYGRVVAIAAIESGVADALLVRALDRATRDQEDAAKLFKQAERNTWRLMDCDKADSGDPSQRLLADIRIAVAAEERRKISERTREGLAKARKAGKRLGRPPQVDPALAKRIVRIYTRDGWFRQQNCPAANSRRRADTARRGEVVPDDRQRCAQARQHERHGKLMARIQKRQTQSGATTYVVKWRTPDGHDRTKGGFRTRKAANAYATKVEAGKLRGVEFDPKAGNTTFREAAQAWLASRHDLKPTTLAGYRKALAVNRCRDPKRLGIDATFGGCPLNSITREQITAWVEGMTAAGKSPVTIRHAALLVKQVLAQAVADKRLPDNPADHVKLPGERGTRAVVDDPAQFLSAPQVTALVAATPWPYNVMVHVAAWAGLRAAELAGLQVGDVELPEPALNPKAPNRPGLLRVERTIQPLNGALIYLAPKTKGSKRRVALTAATTALLRDYLGAHPYGPTEGPASPTAPLFPGMRLDPPQTADLAALSVAEAEARLVLDWAEPLRHLTFYRAVFRPAVARARRLSPHVALPAAMVFHSLRHTYVSLCVAAGIPPLEISRFAGHSKVTTTLGIYAHLFADDHAAAMAALGAMEAGTLQGDNVIPLHG